jgi:autotransporter-associated beta strand protein
MLLSNRRSRKGLDKIGLDTLTLLNSVYSGTTTIAGGTLRAGSTKAFSPNSAYTFGPILKSQNGSLDVTFDNRATLDLNGWDNTIGSLSSTGPGTGIVTNNGATPAILTVASLTFVVVGGKTVEIDNADASFSGAIRDGTSVLGLRKIGTGTLTLTGPSSYSGDTTISEGTLQAGGEKAFSSISAFNVVATLDLNGFSNTIGSLSGTAHVQRYGFALSGSGDQSLTLTGSNTGPINQSPLP